MARILLLSLFFIFFSGFSCAQNLAYVDSLEKSLITAKEDTNKVNTLNELCWQLRKTKPDKALNYCNQSIKLAQKINWDKGLAGSYSRIGVIYQRQNKLSEAREQHLKALSLNKTINNTRGIAVNYSNLSVIAELEHDYQKAIEYNDAALKLSEETNDKESVASYRVNIGNIYLQQANYPLALNHYLSALKIMEEINNIHGLSICYNNIGIIHKIQKNYEASLEFFFKSLEIKEKMKDKTVLAEPYNNIGSIYFVLKDFDKALEYMFKSLTIAESQKDKREIARAYSNIGSAYRQLNKNDLSLEYQLKALAIRTELNDKSGLVNIYNNLGIFYQNNNELDKAIANFEKALETGREIDDKEGIQNAYDGLYNVYDLQKNPEKALAYFKLSNAVKDSIYTLESNKQLTEMQTKFDTEKKEKEISLLTKEKEIQSLHVHKQQAELLKQKLVSETKENEISLLNKDKKINEMALEQQEVELSAQRMETEAKSREVDLLSKDKKIQQAELTRQKMVRNSIGVGLGLVLILAFVSYKGYRTKQKAHQELEIKNKKIESAYTIIEQNRDEIAQKNKDITDSINYAKKIQQAILPSYQLIKQALPESFVLYKPKDIVSGDFYFFANIPADSNRPEQTFIAACDCTGHGVPGAFMSMIGNDQLTHIIIEKGITKPAEILTHLNRNIKNALKQSADGSSSRDGMDIALCCITKNNDQEHELQFAGAYRPLWLIHDAEESFDELIVSAKREGRKEVTQTLAPQTLNITEVSSDKTSIGGLTDDNHQFKNHKIKLKKGNTFYIFSDGYADQFGGEKGKKFKTSRLKELLLSVNEQPMEKQKEILDNEFEAWKKSLDKNENFEQVDDVLIIGVRV